MRDPYLTFVEASRITGVDRRTLAAMPSLRADAPPDRLYGRVSYARLKELFEPDRTPSPKEPA
jgi:hypothetical protein